MRLVDELWKIKMIYGGIYEDLKNKECCAG